MKDAPKVFQIFLFLLILVLMSGCGGYQLKYRLSEPEVVKADNVIPLKVESAIFSDMRDGVERELSVRQQTGDSDVNDYTYDKLFRGQVAEEITKMMVNHLNFSQIFAPDVQIASFHNEEVTAVLLDSLNRSGVDAVLTGDIVHFYGYYDLNVGRQLLYSIPLAVASGMLLQFSTSDGMYETTYYWYGPGLVLGYYLESLHKRQIEQRAQLNARLISTSSQQVLWQDDIDVFITGNRNMPGISTEQNKFKIALNSLRDVVNKMVIGLSDNSQLVMQNQQNGIGYAGGNMPNDVSANQVDQVPTYQPQPEQDQLITPRTTRSEKPRSFGLCVGMNMAKLSGSNVEDAENKFGFNVGVFKPFRVSDNFSIQPEIYYSQKGTKISTNDEYFTAEGTISLNYLDIPLLAVLNLNRNFSVYAGPSMGFFMGGKEEGKMEYNYWGYTGNEKFDEDIDSKDINSPEFGLVFGASFVTSGNVLIGGRYSMGLTNYHKSVSEIEIVYDGYSYREVETKTDYDAKNKVIQFMIGFMF